MSQNQVKTVRLEKTGGPGVMQIEIQELAKPSPGMATVRNHAIGLNFIDTYHRSGLYPLPLPSGLGAEGAGVIEAIGEGAALNVGDRVVYFAAGLGAYSEAVNLPASRLVKLPDDIDFETAAAVALKGATVEYLLQRTYVLKQGETCVFHAAAGGVGLLFGQWANAIGAITIGTVGSDEKAEIARQHGYRHIINYRSEDIVRRVRDLTNGQGVPVVYDGVGRDTFAASLDCLQPRGLMVSFGNASGPPAPFELQTLAAKGSLYITRPALVSYVADSAEMQQSMDDVFQRIRQGDVKVTIGSRYKLDDVRRAHEDLEARRTIGASIMLP